MSQIKASDLFIKALENEAVEYVFGVPGEENLDFLQSIKNSDIKLITTRHEQGAGFMAATYGRLTGKPGVCLSTLGPGATNLVTPAAYAQLGAMPMVIITGQKPIKKSKQGRFQIIDTVDMFRPITKYTHQIVEGGTIPAIVREAFRIATEQRRGAVHIELPEDIAEEITDSGLFEVVGYGRPNAEEACLQTAAKVIMAAKRPLLLIGASANRRGVRESLSEFVDQTGIPFFNTQMGKGVVDERNPNFLGTAALSNDDFLHCAIDQADVIINVGHDVIEKPPFFMKSGKAEVIHINFFSATLDQVYFPQYNVIGNISTSITRLSELLVDRSNWNFSYYHKIKERLEAMLATYSKDTRFPMLPQRLVNIVRESLPEDGIVALDNGIYKIWFARNYKCYGEHTLLLDNALATMGAGLSSAMAAKMVKPDKKVIAICGDGGFMMNSQELETAVRLKLNLTVIILNDGAYGMIKWKQKDVGFDDFGLDYGNPDFVKYAESYGAKGHRPSSDQEFKDIMDTCLSSKGIHVIDLPIDYSLNHSILNVLIKQKEKFLQELK